VESTGYPHHPSTITPQWQQHSPTIEKDTKSPSVRATININSTLFARQQTRSSGETRCLQLASRAKFDLIARRLGTPSSATKRSPLPDNDLAATMRETAQAIFHT
jgi:hypothetical protein